MIAKVQFSWLRTLLTIQRLKHIDVQYHFARDMVEAKRVLPVKLDTLKNVVDALTKSMSTQKLS